MTANGNVVACPCVAAGTRECALREVVFEALDHEAGAFDAPNGEERPLSGADLVEWFAQWRLRARGLAGRHEMTAQVSVEGRDDE
jgi:hypothetical protein